MRNSSFLAISILLVAISFFLQAQDDISARISELEKRCAQQQAIIQTLESKTNHYSTDYTQTIVREYLKKSSPQEDEAGITAGYEEGFFIRSNDAQFELKISGFLQTGVGIFENDSFDKNSFYMQGAYLLFDINFLEKFHAHIEMDFADTGNWNQFQDSPGLSIALYDAYLEYMPFTELNILAGSTYVPFSMTGSHYYRDNPMIWYEPFVNSFDHGYELGVVLYGTFFDQLEYTLGLFNGTSQSLDQNDDKMMAARLRWFFLGQEKNPDTFFHIAFLRSRLSDRSGTDYREAVLYSGWGRQVYDGDDHNFHDDKYGSGRLSESATRGWKTGVDVGLRWTHDFENGSHLHTEVEAMYMNFERNLTTGKLASIHGWGILFLLAYRYPICKEIDGSGIIPSFAFSYTDLDNRDTDELANPGGPEPNIRGQTIFNYTIGLGYAFNPNFKVNFNWIIMDLENHKINPAKDRSNPKDTVEHAWFLQTTVNW